MTLQYQIEVRVTDLLDRYGYDLFIKGELIKTEESEDFHRYAVVHIDNGRMDMILRESHTDAVNIMDFSDPNSFIISITQN